MYYLKIFEEDLKTNQVEIPVVLEMSNYMLYQFSKINDLRRINLTLDNAESYNFYNILNKFLGNDNSLVTEFRDLNNRINVNLDEVYKKIYLLEEEILKDIDKLPLEKESKFLKEKKDFENKNITFGKYLSNLKEIKLILDENKKEIEKELLKCDLIIQDVKKYSNFFYKEKIKEYEESENYFKKIEICKYLEKSVNDKECFEKLNLFFESEIEEKESFELLIIKDEFQCREVLGNINYLLKNNEKILFLDELLKEAIEKIVLIEGYLLDSDLKIEVIGYKEEIIKEKSEEPVLKILNIDLKIKNIVKINNRLEEISISILQEDQFYKIEYINEKYYLIVTNPFKKEILNLEKNIETEFVSKDDRLKIKNNKINIKSLIPGKNYYEIEIENKKEISYKIMYLGLDESIVRVIIKNQVEGVFDSIDFIDGFSTNNLNYNVSKNKISYFSEKENEVYLTGPVLDVEIIKSVEEIFENRYMIVEEIIIKNNFFENIKQILYLREIKEDQITRLFEKNKEIETYNQNNQLQIVIDIKKLDVKEYKLQTLTEKDDLYIEVDGYILEINKYLTSKFENLKKESESIFKNLKLRDIKETYTVSEIQEMYTYENEIKYLRNKYNLYEKYEKEFLYYYRILYQEEVEIEKINKMDDNKYKDIFKAKEDIYIIYKNYKNQEKIIENLAFEEDLKKIEELKEISNKYNLHDIDVDLLVKEKKISEIELMILQKLKEKVDQIYFKINPTMTKLDYREIEGIINKVYFLYDDYSLRDLYNVNYFAGITENDAKRLEKNLVFLDSVLFNKELSNFNQALEKEEYQKAINSVSIETINRVDKIKNDFENLKDGINIIKNDAKKEILEYQEKTYDLDVLELAKTNYESEKYLNTIFLLKSQETKNLKNNQNIPILVSLTIFLLFGLIYGYFKLGGKKKENSIKEKKKKILRH